MSQDDIDTTPLTYREAGVDIDAGARLVERIRPAVARTRRPEVLGNLGGFGALFELPTGRFRQPVLVAGTDGVGTKLKLAGAWGQHQGVGIDLVAMCVNDVLVTGAEPLFFLDYYATARLDESVAGDVIEGIAAGCEQAGCALVGGETAEMPGMYQPGDYDLAGFCVGVVEKDRILDGRHVTLGDALLGIASSGPHANGYSLIRRILERSGAGPDTRVGDRPLAEWLLGPTRIYADALRALLAAVEVRALAHITGGGLPENLPRVLPPGCRAVIDPGAWPRPEIFQWLAEAGRVSEAELLRTFNCGIGMVACLPATAVDEALECLVAAGETAWVIGHIEEAGDDEAGVVLGRS